MTARTLSGMHRPIPSQPDTAKPIRTIAGLKWPVALYLLCLIVPIGFNAGSLAMTSLRLLLLVMIIPITLRLLMGFYGRILLTDVLFFAHIAWAGLALAINNPDQVVQQFGSVGMEFIGGYAIGRAYIRGPEDFTALSRWLVISVLILFPFAILETLSGHALIVETIRTLPGLTSVVPVAAEPRMGLERVQAVFAHPIHFGLFCAVVMSLAFVGLKDRINATFRWGVSGVVGMSGFLALSSGALLAILLQLALFAWSTVFAPIRWRWWLLVGVFVLIYIAIDLLSNRSPLRVFMSYATFSAHTAYWRSIIFEWGLVNVWKHPLFGIGLNDWERPYFMYSGSMDNFWLVMAVRYGIPAFLLLVIGYAWSLIVIMARDFTANPVLTQFRRAWVFTFLGLSFTLCTVHIWANIYSFCFFMYGAGMWLVEVKTAAAGSMTTSTTPKKKRVLHNRTGAALPPAETLPGRAKPPILSGRHHSPGDAMADAPVASPLSGDGVAPKGDPAHPTPAYTRFAHRRHDRTDRAVPPHNPRSGPTR